MRTTRLQYSVDTHHRHSTNKNRPIYNAILQLFIVVLTFSITTPLLGNSPPICSKNYEHNTFLNLPKVYQQSLHPATEKLIQSHPISKYAKRVDSKYEKLYFNISHLSPRNTLDFYFTGESIQAFHLGKIIKFLIPKVTLAETNMDKNMYEHDKTSIVIRDSVEMPKVFDKYNSRAGHVLDMNILKPANRPNLVNYDIPLIRSLKEHREKSISLVQQRLEMGYMETILHLQKLGFKIIYISITMESLAFDQAFSKESFRFIPISKVKKSHLDFSDGKTLLVLNDSRGMLPLVSSLAKYNLTEESKNIFESVYTGAQSFSIQPYIKRSFGTAANRTWMNHLMEMHSIQRLERISDFTPYLLNRSFKGKSVEKLHEASLNKLLDELLKIFERTYPVN
ncbi:MAG: hypothetical protein AB8E15_07665 [Bdellovibrionales bacterium]